MNFNLFIAHKARSFSRRKVNSNLFLQINVTIHLVISLIVNRKFIYRKIQLIK